MILSELLRNRLATFRSKDKVDVLYSVFRVGRTGAVVDNGGAGGLFIAVDSNTGICLSGGCDELGNRFYAHPDSKVSIKGVQIPLWSEAISLVKELSEVIPDQRYVGWDLALTNEGWIMIEGNSWSQFLTIQIPSCVGIRNQISQTFFEWL